MIGRYIATFFSHFGALRFNRELKSCGVGGIIKPVPRSLSSSCGTCVEFEISSENIEEIKKSTSVPFKFSEEGMNVKDPHNEIEQIVLADKKAYIEVYKAKE